MTDKNTVKEEQIEQVNGGSWRVTEFKAREIGLELRNPDGTPGDFGYFWNDGDYYFKGQKLTDMQVMDLINFYDAKDRPAIDLDEAWEYCHNRFNK